MLRAIKELFNQAKNTTFYRLIQSICYLTCNVSTIHAIVVLDIALNAET